jgi:hypothetical protein
MVCAPLSSYGGSGPRPVCWVLSQYYEERYALGLIGERAEGVGYLV